MEIPIKDYLLLKPTALYILYSLYEEKLSYVSETNLCGKIIRVLYENNKYINLKNY